MRNSHPQLLDQVFNETSFLKSIQQRAAAIAKLNYTIKGLLPAQLHPYCRVANYRNHILILETANANWLMRLRYEQMNLLSTLRATVLPSLASIDIKINPSLANYTEKNTINTVDSNNVAPSKIYRKLSTKSAEYLTQLAQDCPDNLRNKLERLAALAYKKP